MTAAIKIIKASLYYVGAHSEVQPAAPEFFTAGVSELSDLLSELADGGIDLGETITLPTDTATDLKEPAAATSALKYLLCERMAPLAQLPIPPDVRVNIRKARQTLERKFRKVVIPNIVPSRLAPVGVGNRGPYNRTFFGGQPLDDDSSTTT